MAVDLKDYVGPLKDADAIAFSEQCAAEAAELVGQYVGAADVPAEVLDRAVLEVGAELFHRRNAKNGVMQLATPDAPATRVARDPMVAAYPLLARYIGGGIA